MLPAGSIGAVKTGAIVQRIADCRSTDRVAQIARIGVANVVIPAFLAAAAVEQVFGRLAVRQIRKGVIELLGLQIFGSPKI